MSCLLATNITPPGLLSQVHLIHITLLVFGHHHELQCDERLRRPHDPSWGAKTDPGNHSGHLHMVHNKQKAIWTQICVLRPKSADLFLVFED